MIVTDQPWLGDACSLVDAFRAGSISPTEALDASLTAIEASGLNAFSHLDIDAAPAGAAAADVSLPFGGVPIGIKELETVDGWPYTEASLVFKDRTADHDSTQITRLRAAGAVLAGQTTASEFGGINCTSTKLHGTTRNPWNPERTPGGSSGGSAAAVSGGLIPLASGGDGGGSIRIPAGFTGLFGLKSTFGRIPKGPGTLQPPLTVVVGCVSRSVRDTARWFDVCNGFDPRDTLSLPRVEGWEAGLDTFDLTGKRAVISIDLGCGDRRAPGGGIAGGGGRGADRRRRPHPGRRRRPTPRGRTGVGHVQSHRPGRRSRRPVPRLQRRPHPRDPAGHEPRHPPPQRADGGCRPRCSASTSTSGWPTSSSRPTSSSPPPIRTPPSPPTGPCPPPSVAWISSPSTASTRRSATTGR